MSDDLSERVMQMIVDQTACRLSDLRPNTDLFRDLGVDGDDAHDLLLRLSDEFGINMENVRFDRHFGPEASLFHPLAAFTPLLPRWWRWQRIPVTVADLIEAARTQTWPIRYSEGIRA
jgi:acyl carrier protein